DMLRKYLEEARDSLSISRDDKIAMLSKHKKEAEDNQNKSKDDEISMLEKHLKEVKCKLSPNFLENITNRESIEKQLLYSKHCKETGNMRKKHEAELDDMKKKRANRDK